MRDVRIAELDRMLEEKWRWKSEAEPGVVAKSPKRRKVNSKTSMRIAKKRYPRGEKSYSQMTEKEADERARERYRLAGLI